MLIPKKPTPDMCADWWAERASLPPGTPGAISTEGPGTGTIVLGALSLAAAGAVAYFLLS
jgi:hypothetical protein